MVAEDNPDIRQGVEIHLNANGYSTIWAEDAEAIVELCDTEKPDLILLDIGLVGGDGFMVMERLRRIDAHTPIIVLSARDPDLNEARAMRLGAVAFMQKPARWKDLLAAIRQFVPCRRELCTDSTA